MSAYGLYITCFEKLVTLSNQKYADYGLNTAMTAPLTNMILMAVQRLLATVFPLGFKIKFTKRIFFRLLAATWAAPILYGSVGTVFIKRHLMLQINSMIILSTCLLLISQYSIIYHFLKTRPTTTRNRVLTRSVLFHSIFVGVAFIFCFTPLSILIFLERFIEKEKVST